jgi:hypothetical protein
LFASFKPQASVLNIKKNMQSEKGEIRSSVNQSCHFQWLKSECAGKILLSGNS